MNAFTFALMMYALVYISAILAGSTVQRMLMASFPMINYTFLKHFKQKLHN